MYTVFEERSTIGSLLLWESGNLMPPKSVDFTAELEHISGVPEHRRALVTGGPEFLDSHLCERLLFEGYRVICMDNLRTRSVENVNYLRDDPDFNYVDHDVSETQLSLQVICQRSLPMPKLRTTQRG